MHYIEAKSILSASNGMNLYRGCQHGCIYCDSRSLCYQMDHLFEDIAVKGNALQLLEQTLRSKRKKCMIGTGSMSDPYMPLEAKLGLTRRSLELIEQYGFGVTLLTKSDLVLRDMELLARINRKTKAVVQMTLTTYDENLCRILEPGVCTTARRIEALKLLRDAGIPTVVWLCPILPFINDTPENILGILEACREAGVRGIIQFGMGVTLREGSREYFYRALDEHFPGMRRRYEETYGLSYELSSPRWRELDGLIRDFCRSSGIETDRDKLFSYLHTFEENGAAEQMSLF